MMNSRFKILVHWINERWQIFQKKEAGQPPPWTDDPILRWYRFCNVHRENDRVTRWLKQYWRDPYAKHPNLLGAMVLARMVNRIETLEFIKFPGNFHDTFVRLRNWRAMGKKVFSAAYLITTCGVRMDKLDYVERVAMSAATTDLRCTTLEEAHRDLMAVKGLGTFLAAQVLADLKNTPGHPLNRATDFSVWAAPGPGSRRGLKALLEKDGLRYKEHQALQDMQRYHNMVQPHLDLMPYIDLQDFQNCLCEFDKYLRTKEGRGTPKQFYKPDLDRRFAENEHKNQEFLQKLRDRK